MAGAVSPPASYALPLWPQRAEFQDAVLGLLHTRGEMSLAWLGSQLPPALKPPLGVSTMKSELLAMPGVVARVHPGDGHTLFVGVPGAAASPEATRAAPPAAAAPPPADFDDPDVERRFHEEVLAFLRARCTDGRAVPTPELANHLKAVGLKPPPGQLERRLFEMPQLRNRDVLNRVNVINNAWYLVGDDGAEGGGGTGGGGGADDAATVDGEMMAVDQLLPPPQEPPQLQLPLLQHDPADAAADPDAVAALDVSGGRGYAQQQQLYEDAHALERGMARMGLAAEAAPQPMPAAATTDGAGAVPAEPLLHAHELERQLQQQEWAQAPPPLPEALLQPAAAVPPHAQPAAQQPPPWRLQQQQRHWAAAPRGWQQHAHRPQQALQAPAAAAARLGPARLAAGLVPARQAHINPPVAHAERVILLDLENQQAAVVLAPGPGDFVEGHVASLGLASLGPNLLRARFPVTVHVGGGNDYCDVALLWRLGELVHRDGLRPGTQVVVISRDAIFRAMASVVRNAVRVTVQTWDQFCQGIEEDW